MSIIVSSGAAILLLPQIVPSFTNERPRESPAFPKQDALRKEKTGGVGQTVRVRRYVSDGWANGESMSLMVADAGGKGDLWMRHCPMKRRM